MAESFEHQLAQAFAAERDSRPDLVEAVLVRAERRRARRRSAVVWGVLAGVALSAAMLGASGVLIGLRWELVITIATTWLSHPLAVCAVGAALLLGAVSRNLLRDI